MDGERFVDCSPIFVVGSGRSGTTLLQLMLNAHPNVAVAGELHFFDQVLKLRTRVADLHSAEQVDQLIGLLPSVAGFRYLTDVEPVVSDARRRLLAAERPSYGLLYRYLLEGFSRQQGARRFGEKTTVNLRYLDDLVELFPDSRIIHIVRDPRPVVASCLKVPWASDDVVSNALRWKLEVSCARSFVARPEVADHRFLEVRYEDLVADPAGGLRRVCKFIGEPYDERMLEYHRSAARFVRREPWKHGATKPVYRSSLDSWRRQLSEPQIFLIELITRAGMKYYRYPQSKISRSAALLSPWQGTREIGRWFKYKWMQHHERRREDSIHGSQRRLVQILWRQWIGAR